MKPRCCYICPVALNSRHPTAHEELLRQSNEKGKEGSYWNSDGLVLETVLCLCGLRSNRFFFSKCVLYPMSGTQHVLEFWSDPQGSSPRSVYETAILQLMMMQSKHVCIPNRNFRKKSTCPRSPPIRLSRFRANVVKMWNCESLVRRHHRWRWCRPLTTDDSFTFSKTVARILDNIPVHVLVTDITRDNQFCLFHWLDLRRTQRILTKLSVIAKCSRQQPLSDSEKRQIGQICCDDPPSGALKRCVINGLHSHFAPQLKQTPNYEVAKSAKCRLLSNMSWVACWLCTRVFKYPSGIYATIEQRPD